MPLTRNCCIKPQQPQNVGRTSPFTRFYSLYLLCSLSRCCVNFNNLPCCSFRCFKLRVLFSFFLCFNQGVSPLIPGGEDEITFELEGESFGVADTCQSATVPSYFQPYTTTTPVDWIASGAFMSYGYR